MTGRDATRDQVRQAKQLWQNGSPSCSATTMTGRDAIRDQVRQAKQLRQNGSPSCSATAMTGRDTTRDQVRQAKRLRQMAMKRRRCKEVPGHRHREPHPLNKHTP